MPEIGPVLIVAMQAADDEAAEAPSTEKLMSEMAPLAKELKQVTPLVLSSNPHEAGSQVYSWVVNNFQCLQEQKGQQLAFSPECLQELLLSLTKGPPRAGGNLWCSVS